MFTGPQVTRLADGRLHLNHGPIDLIIEAFGSSPEIEAAYRQAGQAFQPVLNELVGELSMLRTSVGTEYPLLTGPVARRMAAAIWPLRKCFITPMAAVAGAVADHILHHMVQNRELERAYVNNGGDVALYLNTGMQFKTGLVSHTELPELRGNCTIHAGSPVRGIATSGWCGRSFSLGIADAVTVLAETAAQADAAATLIANAVNIDHSDITRQAACELDADSDLGSQQVTIAVSALSDDAIMAALENGCDAAKAMQAQGLIHSAALFLQNHYRIVGEFESGFQIRSPTSDAKQ